MANGEGEATAFRPAAGRNRGGRPREPQSLRSLAVDPMLPIGLRATKSTIHRWLQHTAACNRYPVLKGSDWSQRRAIHAARCLDVLPDEIRDGLILQCNGLPASVAVNLIDNACRDLIVCKLSRIERMGEDNNG